MQTTGIFTIHDFKIEFDKFNEPIYLIPFGDVHRSAPLCHVEKWLEFLDWAKNKKRAYFLGIGDYDDLASASERLNLDKKRFHDSTIKTLEQLYEKNINTFYNEIKFMKDRLIGLAEGNHYAEFSSGITSTQLLAQKLNAKYLGVSSFIRLSLFNKNSKKSMSIDLFIHHGKGAGKRMGTSLNTVEDMIRIADADIYLMGHDHKKSCGYLTKLQLHNTPKGGLKLHNKKILMARTGSFLKGYVPEESSYIADANYNPADLGTIKIELTPRRITKDGSDNIYIDIHTSI